MMHNNSSHKLNVLSILKKVLNTTIIVSALGYFVDIFDLILYGILRHESLKDLRLSPVDIDVIGERLLNLQMGGFLIGGILWGVLGDKIGRKKILFGSITIYSVFTFLNGFVTNTFQYGACRFLAGVGLAGELGVAITLAVETLPKEIRTYGTTLIASLGLFGAVFAYLLNNFFGWRTMYIIGGSLGLVLLIFRFRVLESTMFEHTKVAYVPRGAFLKLFSSPERFFKYLTSIMIALPIWYLLGIYIVFSQEMAQSLNMQDAHLVSNGKSIAIFYFSAAIGDIFCGLLSQKFKSRKKAILIWFIFAITSLGLYYLFLPGKNYKWYYAFSVMFGLSIGYWTVFVTIAAEQFGTNLRATVATTSPNFIRASLIPITYLFRSFMLIGFQRPIAALWVGIICFSIAFISLAFIKETFKKDLDYVEEI